MLKVQKPCFGDVSRGSEVGTRLVLRERRLMFPSLHHGFHMTTSGCQVSESRVGSSPNPKPLWDPATELTWTCRRSHENPHTPYLYRYGMISICLMLMYNFEGCRQSFKVGHWEKEYLTSEKNSEACNSQVGQGFTDSAPAVLPAVIMSTSIINNQRT